MHLLAISLILVSLGGAVCLYWGFQFHTQSSNDSEKYIKLEKSVQQIECSSLNKDAVLSVEHNSIDRKREFGDLLQIIAIIFFVTGIMHIAIMWKVRSNQTS
jgi:hypothetical protein